MKLSVTRGVSSGRSGSLSTDNEGVNYIPMGFNNCNLKKVCEWFPPAFLMKEKVFAIQEVEPTLLKLFTRVHETANKQGRKRGGRKVLLLGQEVFGDTFLACGRCGYHSTDNSNVRKHHRRKVCLVDRGYNRSQLKSMDANERKNFLQQLSSRRYREKCKNLAQQQQQQQQQQQASENSDTKNQPPQAQLSSSHTTTATTTTATVVVQAAVSSTECVTTVVSQTGPYTQPALQTTARTSTDTSHKVTSPLKILEQEFTGRGNAVSTTIGLFATHCGSPSGGTLVKAIDCADLLDSPSEDLLDRCALNSEMESCALLENITNSDIECNGGHNSSNDRINIIPAFNNISSYDTALDDIANTTSKVSMKQITVNPVTSRSNVVAQDISKVISNLTSYSKSTVNNNPEAGVQYAVEASSYSNLSNRILLSRHVEELSSPLLSKADDSIATKNKITKVQHPSAITCASNEEPCIIKEFTAEHDQTSCNLTSGNGAVDSLMSYNAVTDATEAETIVIVPNYPSEDTQPNLCIISMLEERKRDGRIAKPLASPLTVSSPYFESHLQFVPLPSSSLRDSIKETVGPSLNSNAASDKVLPQSWNDPNSVSNLDAILCGTESRDFPNQSEIAVVQSLACFTKSTNSVRLGSTKVSFFNDVDSNICRIIYADTGVANQVITSKVTEMDPVVQATVDSKISTPTASSLNEHRTAGNACFKPRPSTDSSDLATPKKKANKRKGLTLGPVVPREPIKRLPYDLYTVNEHRQRVAWKPPFCHKAAADPDSVPCQIAFRGARRCRRCLALPLPYLLLYRKLDCRTHHCHFTLFHPHARHQQALQGRAVRASIGVRIFADTVMGKDFHHYLRSLWSCRLKPSQASRHITGVWAQVLRDRVTEYHADLERHQSSPPPLEGREHRRRAVGDKDSGQEQRTQDHRDHHQHCSHDPLHVQEGSLNTDRRSQEKNDENESLKRSDGGTGADIKTLEKLSKKVPLGASSLDEVYEGNSSVEGCCYNVCGSSTDSCQLKKPRSQNPLGERYRNITSLSKQTVKMLWRRLEEEESYRPSLDGFRSKRVGGPDRRKDRLHCRVVKKTSLLQTRTQLKSTQQHDSTRVLHTDLRTYGPRLGQARLLPSKNISTKSRKTNLSEVGGDDFEHPQSFLHDQQIRKQCEPFPETDCQETIQMPQHSVSECHPQGILYSDSSSVRGSQHQYHDTVGRAIDDVTCNTRDPHAHNDPKMCQLRIPSSVSGCIVSVSPTLQPVSLLTSNATYVQVMAPSAVKCLSNPVHLNVSQLQLPAQTRVPLGSVPAFSHCASTMGIRIPLPTTTTHPFHQIQPTSTSPSDSYVTQPPLLMRQAIPQPPFMQTGFITRFHLQNSSPMQPALTNTSLRSNQPLHQLFQGSYSTSQEFLPDSRDPSSSVRPSAVSSQLANAATVLQPVPSLSSESWSVSPTYSHHHQQRLSCNGSEGKDTQCANADRPEYCSLDSVGQQCQSLQQYQLAAVTAGVSASASSYNLQLYSQAPHVAYHEQ